MWRLEGLTDGLTRISKLAHPFQCIIFTKYMQVTSVHVNPVDEHLVLSASNDHTSRISDIRRLSGSLATTSGGAGAGAFALLLLVFSCSCFVHTHLIYSFSICKGWHGGYVFVSLGPESKVGGLYHSDRPHR